MLKYNTEQIISLFKEIHGEKYDYSLVEYSGNLTPVKIICPVHGIFEQKPAYHKNGSICKKCKYDNLSKIKLKSLDNFIIEANKIHDNKYDYSKVTYKGSKKPVVIICPFHGEFKQKPNNHLCGEGCRSCSVQRMIDKRKLTTEEFIKRSKEIHKTKYDYSLVDYINSHTPVKIVCSVHGIFTQRPSDHISRKNGCNFCAKENKPGWSKTQYVSFCKKFYNSKSYFYLIKCLDMVKEEEFYKLGIAVKGVKERYRNKTLMPYKYQIILEKRLNASFVWSLEKELKRKFFKKKYKPLKTFQGSFSECFILTFNDLEFIEEQLKEYTLS